MAGSTMKARATTSMSTGRRSGVARVTGICMQALRTRLRGAIQRTSTPQRISVRRKRVERHRGSGANREQGRVRYARQPAWPAQRNPHRLRNLDDDEHEAWRLLPQTQRLEAITARALIVATT